MKYAVCFNQGLFVAVGKLYLIIEDDCGREYACVSSTGSHNTDAPSTKPHLCVSIRQFELTLEFEE